MISRLRPIAFVIGALVLATCSDKLEQPTLVHSDAPGLSVSPDTLYFAVPGDSLLPGTKVVGTIEVRNSGGDSLLWALSEDISWLTLSPDSGVSWGETDSVDVVAWYGTIGDGEVRTGDIIVTALTFKDTVHVVASNGIVRQMCAAESLIVFTVGEGTRSVQVRACGNWETIWKAKSNTGWIRVAPAGSSSSGEWDDVWVTVDWTKITRPGPRVGSITVSGPHNDVDIEVQAWWPLCVDHSSLAFDEKTSPGPVDVATQYCGPGGTLDWTVGADQPWVLLSPTSGTSTGEWDSVQVAIDWSFDFSTVVTAADTRANITFDGGSDVIVVPLQVHPACRVVFTDPIASTVWMADSVETVQWRKYNAGYNVRLELFKGAQKVWDLGMDPWGTIPNNGERQWVVTTKGLPSGSDYRFYLSPDEYGYCGAWSDSFTVVVPECHVSVVRPSQYDTSWNEGSTRSIQWITHAPATDVSIDLYLNGSLVCNIVPSTRNDGSYDWVVDSCGGGPGWYQVRVSDVADPACTGTSQFFSF